MKAPIVLCVATNVNENLLGWIRSLNRCQFSYRILGLGECWGGWSWRAKKYLEALHTFDPQDVVIICDAFDVFALRPSEAIMSKFISLDVDIIAGAERCEAENVANLDAWYTYHEKPVHATLPHLNAGFVMGKVFRLIKMYEFISHKEDDQIGMGEFFCTYPWRLAVDVARAFVYNHQYVRHEAPTDAYFIHFPGFKYLPDTAIAYKERLDEMLADEVDEKVKERMAVRDCCPGKGGMGTPPEKDIAGQAICTLDSIYQMQRADACLDPLAEAMQIETSLDRLARGQLGVGSCTVEATVAPCNLHTAVLEAGPDVAAAEGKGLRKPPAENPRRPGALSD